MIDSLRNVLHALEAAVVADPKQAAATFAEHTHPDYVFTSPAGRVSRRAEVLDALKKGRAKFSSYEMTDLDIREFEGWALVIGRATGDGINPGGELIHGDYRFTSVWTMTSGSWKLVAWQTTKIDS